MPARVRRAARGSRCGRSCARHCAGGRRRRRARRPRRPSAPRRTCSPSHAKVRTRPRRAACSTSREGPCWNRPLTPPRPGLRHPRGWSSGHLFIKAATLEVFVHHASGRQRNPLLPPARRHVTTSWNRHLGCEGGCSWRVSSDRTRGERLISAANRGLPRPRNRDHSTPCKGGALPTEPAAQTMASSMPRLLGRDRPTPSGQGIRVAERLPPGGDGPVAGSPARPTVGRKALPWRVPPLSFSTASASRPCVPTGRRRCRRRRRRRDLRACRSRARRPSPRRAARAGVPPAR